MQLFNVIRNAESLQGGQILTSQDMHDVLAWAKDHGYTGHINLDEAGNFTMALTSPNRDTSQTARLGDWAVLKNGAVVNLVDQTQAGALYSIAPS